jgi:ABC-2 type transport system permease protein
MPGFGILLRKEWLESWRTYRTAVVGGLFLFVGISSPLLAKYLPEILKAAGGDQLGNLVIPTPTASDAVEQLWKNLAQFGAFAAIILAMGAVSTEQDRGTAAFVLSKTASRGAFLGAKVASIAGLLAIATIIAVAVGWIYTAILFEPPPVAGWVGLAVLAWIGLAAWAAIAFLGSTVTGSIAAAAGIGFAALLVFSIVAAVPTIAAYTPGGLAGPAVALATGAPVDAGAIATPVVSTLVVIGLALAASVWSFRRREL